MYAKLCSFVFVVQKIKQEKGVNDMKKILFAVFAVMLAAVTTFAPVTAAHAQGGTGGGGTTPTFTNLSGNWLGVTQFGAPVFTSTTNLQMTQDVKGNITGTFCTSQDGTGLVTCSPLTGKWINQFQFQLKFSEGQETGMVSGNVTCSDGSTGLWVSGSEQNSGATGSFSYTTCSVYPFN